MRTLQTQVKLRRLIRAFGEARSRLASEPLERRLVGPLVDRLLELAADVRESWRREALLRPLEAPLDVGVQGRLQRPQERLPAPGLTDIGGELQKPIHQRTDQPALERLGGQARPRLAEGADQPPQLDLGLERTHVWNSL